ncbi:LuxR C-terminal-related transcriptional regulator [Microbacterium sp. zg.Y1090]|uniref:helix-turn-helix transcriptional regulator n=1 Tax=Microbacterium wangruii TaxID=3049073 RepID=UPI00214D04D0|nr:MULTISPECIES: LuxR family transcriptional regulator [unclassified Microbacterium]MCR2817509.1 LuxR C-terminal-related transcriptional regulator [Microbacterium sp. zg.Y1090]WIM29008.1 LuxR C-terminal-related transcriptional regulator [Microbacterium sp. zg-Y1090]
MAHAPAYRRARDEIDLMSRAGFALPAFAEHAIDALGRVLGFAASCLSTIDPTTAMVAGALKTGALAGRDDGDRDWAQIEYGRDDPTAYRALLARREVVATAHTATSGVIERSPRMSELMVPLFGFHDEARVLLADRTGPWGGLALFRGADDRPFSPAEAGFLGTLAPALARGIRTGLLAGAVRHDEAAAVGPAVIVVDTRDHIVQCSDAAAEALQRVAADSASGDPLVSVQALVTAVRRVARGDAERMPRLRIRRGDGVWLLLQAAPLMGEGRSGDVVVTIEHAHPQDVIDLVGAAYGLTARENEVLRLVLRGGDTRAIAGTMGVSPYTVQDHLKSIFAKVGVASRRELVSRVSFDQDLPRAAAAPPASGIRPASGP